MREQRWLRIIPVALIMYTISFIDRTNISLALDRNISTMMKDLLMDDKMKGFVGGIFFFGYVTLQIPGGHWAKHWSARKLIAIFLVFWGVCAVGCGLVKTFGQFELMRFMLGVAESGVYPATLVLLTNWFPRQERARANAYWNLCMPLAAAFSAPITAALLGKWGWQTMLIVEGALPFIWLPVWLKYIADRPSQAKWISTEEREYLEKALAAEANQLQPVKPAPVWQAFLQPAVFVMLPVYFLQNCAAYGCNTFLTEGFKNQNRTFTAFQSGLLFSLPYLVAAVLMILNSRSSDRTGERRGHAALAYGVSGICLIASVWLKDTSFWLSYAFLCFAIPGPFAALAPFWSIPSETMPTRVVGAVIGLVNAIGNVGGFVGQFIVGALKERTHGITIPFTVLGSGLILGAALCFLLPKSQPRRREVN